MRPFFQTVQAGFRRLPSTIEYIAGGALHAMRIKKLSRWFVTTSL